MNVYTLDTNICSLLLKDRSPSARRRLNSCRRHDLFLSAVVAAELRFGARKLGSPELTQRVEGWLSLFPIEPWPVIASEPYANLRASLEANGQRIGAMDLMLAAHALAAGAIVVTNNLSEFTRVPGLRVEDWSEA